MIEPLHTTRVGSHELRFFRTPLADGRPDLPWHAVDDLQRCLGLNREARKFFLKQLRQWGEIRTVATANGVVTLAPHYMAQGLIDATVETGRAPESFRAEYDRAGAAALKKLAPAHFPDESWLLWIKAAMHRWEGVGGPTTAV